MRPLALAITFVALVAASAPAQKDDEFLILIASPRAKEKVDVTVDETVDSTITLFLAGENRVHKEKAVRFYQYTDDIITGDTTARLPNKVKRFYEKATKDDGNGSQGHPLQQQTIIIEKRGSDYVYTVADKKQPLDKEAKATLDNEFNTLNKIDLRDVMISKQPVKNNGTWDIERKALTGVLFQDVFKFDDAKIKATGQVENAKPEPKKDKRPQTAKVTIKVTAPIVQFSLEKGMVKAKEGSKLDVTIVGDGHIDGLSPEGTVTMTMKFKMTGTSAEGLDIEIDTTAKQTRIVKFADKK